MGGTAYGFCEVEKSLSTRQWRGAQDLHCSGFSWKTLLMKSGRKIKINQPSQSKMAAAFCLFMVNGMLLLHTVLSLSVSLWPWVNLISLLCFRALLSCGSNAAFGFTIATAASFSRDKKPLYRSSLPLLKRKSLELTSFITNEKKILSLAPAKRRPKQDLSWPLSISCTLTIFVFILPAAFAVTVKQGNSKELYKKYKNLKGHECYCGGGRL